MEDRTKHVLLTGRQFKAQIDGVVREITPAVIIDRYTFGIGILYKKDSGEMTGSMWGPLCPALPARCFRAMKILEYITDFDVESRILSCAWNAANISHIHSINLIQVEKIESIIGIQNLMQARAEKMTANDIDTLVVNLNKVQYPKDGKASFYDCLDFTYESEGLYPKTVVTDLYFKNELPIDTEPPKSCALSPKEEEQKLAAKVEAPKVVPLFSEVMKFNKFLLPLFRQKFGYGDFTHEQALSFLGITQEEYRKIETSGT